MIQIGTIKSIGRADDHNVRYDDRQQLVQVVTNTGAADVVVEDYGVVDNGEVISCSAVFDSDSYDALVLLWKNRTLSSITLEDGTTFTGRVVIKGTTYYDKIMPMYKKVTLEFWRI